MRLFWKTVTPSAPRPRRNSVPTRSVFMHLADASAEEWHLDEVLPT
jgi:hypothetical protein